MEKNFNQVTHDGHVKYDDEKVRDHCDITGKCRGAAIGVMIYILN